MTKKTVLVASILGVVVFGFAMFTSIKGICSMDLICSRPHNNVLGPILFPVIPLFIFSLVTYKMKDEVFQLWWKFARIWTPLSMLAILIAPEYASNILSPIEKGSVALFFSGMFILISTVLVVFQRSNLRKR